MIKAILHVQIAVAKEFEQDTIKFYKHILGFKEIPKPENLQRNGGAWFELGLQQFHIAPEDVPREYNSNSKRHICFIVEDLVKAEILLKEAGVEVIADNQPVRGFKRFYLRDPAGNRVELAELSYLPS